jgi:hypothetical protein
MDMKIKDLENIGKTVGLKIICEKTKSLRINVECNKKFQIRGENVEVEKFIYLGSETEVEVKTHIQKANSAFAQLYTTWKAESTTTKLGISKTNVKSVCSMYRILRTIRRTLIFKHFLKKITFLPFLLLDCKARLKKNS